MIKKFDVVGLAVFVMLTFNAIAVSSAFAESPEWLIDGASISGPLTYTTSHARTFSDLEVPIVGTTAVKCEDFSDGTISPAGKSELAEVLNTSGEKIGENLTGISLKCSQVTNCEGTSKVWPVGLPYSMQLELLGGAVINDDVSLSPKKLLGYEVECRTFGVTEVDECTTELIFVEIINMLEGGSDLLEFIKIINGFNCSISGKKSGDMEGEGLLTTTLSITVSGDGVSD